MEPVEFAPGDVLCAVGQSAENLYLIERGTAVLITPGGREAPLRAPHCGEEAAAGLKHYVCTVTATPGQVKGFCKLDCLSCCLHTYKLMLLYCSYD